MNDWHLPFFFTNICPFIGIDEASESEEESEEEKQNEEETKEEEEEEDGKKTPVQMEKKKKKGTNLSTADAKTLVSSVLMSVPNDTRLCLMLKDFTN